jgi:periplasmic divalent cation tolerance protein
MTASSREEADRIAESLVREGLAACVNVVDTCRSFYRWQGELVKDSEFLMLAKTHRSKFPQIEKRVTELHSYSVPEIIAVDLTAVAAGYRKFLEELLS